MSTKESFCLAVFALLLVSSFGIKDPELKQCEHQCKVQQQFDERQREGCVRRYEEYSRQKQEREHGDGGGSYGEGDQYWNRESPIERLRECVKSCETQQGRQRERCQSSCQKEYEKERERYEGNERQEEEEGEEKQQHEENPYVFEDHNFVTGPQTQHGRVRILPDVRFKHAVDDVLQKIIFLVVLLLILSIEIRMKAGTTAYLINRDQNERLVLANLMQPVSTPGNFEAFYGAGGENPESFYRVFSNEILEAAFNVRRDRIEKLFGQQRQGAILKVSREQIQGMSHHEEGGIWPFGGGESKGTFNIYEQHPTHANQFGQLYEVDSSHLRSLQDLDVAVTLTNITRGAMTALYYNSRATKICVVKDGAGFYEMACHVMSLSQNHHEGSSQREQPGSRRESSGTPRYQKISSRLKRGTVVVVPVGHPFVAVASNNQNLQLMCFVVHANDNEKHALAGKRNVINQLERGAKELAFGVPEREVDQVFRSQEEEFFFKGPRQQHRSFSDI
ncbi:vicilin Cor a 11.0101-like [Primulina huaijiensis]|uniref:vicilin Cor a 11.0101-like n=1 Tax=Primulina huaijiensis TaxID=1492673 RepID=UPI003CC6EC26